MIKQVFINLPVADLPRTRAFWEALGFSFNEQFSDENAASLVLGENIFAMLLTNDYFGTFTDRAIIDTKTGIEVINAFAVESRAEVDRIVDGALAQGASEPRPPQDHGWMYYRVIHDLDGHRWEFTFMDMAAAAE
jgi:predicted lactoylglutathione lyase